MCLQILDFIWLEHNETGQLVVYTRSQYKDKTKKLLRQQQWNFFNNSKITKYLKYVCRKKESQNI